jgi:hypothetical protein
MWAQGLAHLSWNLKFFFQSYDWTSELKLFYEGLIAESLKSEPKAWLKWAEMLIYFFILCDWTSNLKVFYEGLVAESLKYEPEAWLTWAEILIFFSSFFVIELQTSSCFMKVSLPRAWNLSTRLGLHELKFNNLFSIIWLNFKPQAILWRSRCRELEILAQSLDYMNSN